MGRQHTIGETATADNDAGRLDKKEPAPAGRRLRRSYEAGHSPKLLVVVDETLDCEKAVHYASRRAARIGGKVALLRVIEPFYRGVAWLGVAHIMEAEAREQAREFLGQHVKRAESVAAVSPETVIREGDAAQEILNLIEADEDIAVLVLAAGSTEKGPGPLVSDLARTAGTYPIPVVIVPAHLTDAELDALS
jgi:nucleotide-binding universal stress UspA family protein